MHSWGGRGRGARRPAHQTYLDRQQEASLLGFNLFIDYLKVGPLLGLIAGKVYFLDFLFTTSMRFFTVSEVTFLRKNIT